MEDHIKGSNLEVEPKQGRIQVMKVHSEIIEENVISFINDDKVHEIDVEENSIIEANCIHLNWDFVSG